MVKDNKTADTFRIEGNSLYHESKIYDALVCYNKSLCFALPKSKQMAVAYANRSAVYMRLQLYDQSLENIQLARDNNYPNESTLREFERDCLLLKMDHHPDPENDASSFFKLSYPAKEKLPFIANCLELRQDLKYGRHIATNQDLNPGDVIAIEKPFFKVVHKAGRYKRCTNCLKFNMLNLIPCDGDCSSSMFCNQKCMTKARKRFHHAECNSYFDNLLGDATEEGFPLLMLTIQRRLLQSLEIAQSIDSLRELMNDAEPKTVFDFDLSVDDPSTDMTYLLAVNSLQVRSNSMAKEMYDQTIATHLSELDLPSFVDSEEDRKDLVKYTTRLMLISDRNGHGIQNSSGAAEGSGIFPFGSLFNHSCDPNLQQIVNENKLIFVVVKPIAKDEQLFITYKGTFEEDPICEERRRKLLEDYQFECSCPACAKDYTFENLPMLDAEFVDSGDEVPATYEETIEEFRKNCSYIKDNFGRYPTVELVVLQMRNLNLLRKIASLSFWPFENL